MKNHLYRKAWSLLIALSCVLSVLPVNIQAEENETVILDEITETVSTDNGQEDNDELFAEYVDRLFTAKETVQPGRKKAAGKPSVALDEPALTVYNAMYERAAAVAAGTESSTVIEFENAALGIGENNPWTAAELGVSAIVENGAIAEAAKEAVGTKLKSMIDPGTLVQLLMAKYPYEFYWYDKTVGVSYAYGIGASHNGSEYVIYPQNYKISLSVAQEYAAGQYQTDTAITSAAVTAASNAKDIVSKHASLGDKDKLYEYKTEICNLVSYNTAAAENDSTPYGNPWQLIWVFDGDASTTVVCEGYSKAFQYLCDMSSFESSKIDCISVTGTMAGGTGAGPHMWNIVTLMDGRHYLTDITNSDTDTIGDDDSLFLAKYESGSVNDGYVFRNTYGKQISYVYDDETRSLYTEADLTIYDLPRSGSCGEGVTYSVDNNGVLVLAGNGKVEDNPDYLAFADEIRTIQIGENITGLSETAFAGINQIESLSYGSCYSDWQALMDTYTGSELNGINVQLAYPLEEYDWHWAEDMSSGSVDLICGKHGEVEVNVPAEITSEGTGRGTIYHAVAEFNGTVYTYDYRNPMISKLYFTESEYRLSEGGTLDLYEIICAEPSEPLVWKDLIFETSNTSIAQITDNVLSYVSPGTVTLYAIDPLNTDMRAECTVILENLSFTPLYEDPVTVNAGDSYTVKYEITGASSVEYQYYNGMSGGNSYISIEGDTFTFNQGIPGGSYTYAIYANDTQVGTITFNVIKKATSISIAADSVYTTTQKSVTIPAYLQPWDATAPITYSSSDPSVASFDDPQLNTLTLHKSGKTVLTADAGDGITASAEITVYDLDCATKAEVDYYTQYRVKKGQTKSSPFTLVPEGQSYEDDRFTYISSDQSIASVDENGNVTGIATGTAIITVFGRLGELGSCSVSVYEEPVSISFTKDTYTLKSGQYSMFMDDYLVFEPAGSENAGYTWSVTEYTVSIDSNTGRVYYNEPGTTELTVTSNDDPSVTATCTIITSEGEEAAPTGIILPDTATAYVGGTLYLRPTLEPKEASYYKNYNFGVYLSNDNLSTTVYLGQTNLIPLSCDKAGITEVTVVNSNEQLSKTITVTILDEPISNGVKNETYAIGKADGTRRMDITPEPEEYTFYTGNRYYIERSYGTYYDRQAYVKYSDYANDFTAVMEGTGLFENITPSSGGSAQFGEDILTFLTPSVPGTAKVVIGNKEVTLHVVGYTDVPASVETDTTVSKDLADAISAGGTYGVDLSSDADTVTIDDETASQASENEKIVVQTYMDVSVSNVEDNGTSVTMTVDITPMYQIVKLNQDQADDEAGTAIGAPQELEVNRPVEMVIPTGNTFPEGSTVYIRHVKKEGTVYLYTGTVENNAVRFINSHGFSTFEITSEDTAVAKIGKTGYETLQGAVNAVKDGQTITVVTNEAMTAEVSGVKTFTIENNDNVTITPAEGYRLSQEGTLYIVTESPLKKTEAKDPTCEEEGNTAYWTDTETGKYYSDSQGEHEITEGSWIIPATGHKWGEVTVTWNAADKTATATVTCLNDSSHVLTETVTYTEEVTTPATPTEAGEMTYTAVFTNELFGTQTKKVQIPATGYTYKDPVYTWSDDNKTVTAEALSNEDPAVSVKETVDTTYEVTVKPGCETEGTGTYTAVFENEMFEKQTKTEVIPALGHEFSEVLYTWSSDNKTVTASRICARDLYKEEETANTTYEVTKDPTCEAEGTGTYKAVFTNPAFETQTKDISIPATGHKYGTPEYTWDGDKVTAKAVCEHDSTHVVTETVTAASEVTTEPTCEEPGVRTYTAVFDNEMFEKQTKTEEIPAIGHEWGEVTVTWNTADKTATASSTCAHDPDHVLTETVTYTEEITTPATPTEAGEMTYTAVFINELFGTQTKKVQIPATGYTYKEPVYTWSEDNKTVTAEAVSNEDPAVSVKETVNTAYEVTVQPGCETEGKGVYTAVFTNQMFKAQTKEVSIPATGHNYGEPEYSWSDDNKTVTAKRVCRNDPSHIEEETVNAAVTVTKEATCTEAGEAVYTASFQNTAFEKQTKTEEIPALGHNYEFKDWEWSDDYYTAKAKFECSACHEVVYAVGFVEKTETPATCETDGSIVYTVSVVYRDTEYTDTKTVVIPATGHDYGEPEYTWSDDNKTATAKRVCKNDPSHVDSETVKTTYKVTVQPGCETEGEGTYTAAFTNKAFTTQTKTVVIPATGHKYGTPTYTWNGDKVTAKAVCEHDSTHVITETVTATNKVTTEATCEKDGVRTYTAVFKNSMFKTQTKTEAIPAIGHKYGTPVYTWSSDNKTVTATVTCTNDKSHKITETVNTTYKVTKEATETAEGTGTYTAAFKNSLFKTQTKNVTIPKKTPAVQTVEMYRLYNPNSGEHFYTAKAKERDVLASIGWQYEGIGWYAPAESSTPVYRLYNENAGDHHYTKNKAERDALIKVGWKDEKIGWYSDDNEEVPLYRQYNPNAVSGSHNYTTNKKENDALVKIGWIAEGIGWYGVKN